MPAKATMYFDREGNRKTYIGSPRTAAALAKGAIQGKKKKVPTDPRIEKDDERKKHNIGGRAGYKYGSRVNEKRQRERREAMEQQTGRKRKEDPSPKTLGKFMKAKIDSTESTVKKGGMGADRVISKYRDPERAAKFIKSGGLRKGAKDAKYYKDIGLTGKRGEQAVKDFFKPESKKMPLGKLLALSKKNGGRASYNSGGAIKVRDINKDGKKEGWEVARAKGMAKGMGKRLKMNSGGAVLKGKKVGCQIK